MFRVSLKKFDFFFWKGPQLWDPGAQGPQVVKKKVFFLKTSHLKRADNYIVDSEVLRAYDATKVS